MSYHFVKVTSYSPCTWKNSLKVLGIHKRESLPKASEILTVGIPLKVWVYKIMKCICMRCWQASLWWEKTQETLPLFNFWNPFLCASATGHVCKFLKLHPHKTTKLGTVSRKGAFWIHQSENKHIWKTDLRKGQTGGSRNPLKALMWMPVSIYLETNMLLTTINFHVTWFMLISRSKT